MVSRLPTTPSLRGTLTSAAAILALMLLNLYLEYQSSLVLLTHGLRPAPPPKARPAGASANESWTSQAWRSAVPAELGALEYARVPARTTPNNWTCVLLHGLGAQHGSDAYALRTALLRLRPALFDPVAFLIPLAQPLPVSVFAGNLRPAWFDIRNWSDLYRHEDAPNMHRNVHRLRDIILRENVDLSRTIIAGFSQGAVMSLLLGLTLDPPPAGIIMLSGYLPMARHLQTLFGPRPSPTGPQRADRAREVGPRRTIVHWLHGAKDPYFPLPFAQNGFHQLHHLALFAPQNLSFSSIANLDHTWSVDELNVLALTSLDRLLPSSTPPS